MVLQVLQFVQRFPFNFPIYLESKCPPPTCSQNLTLPLQPSIDQGPCPVSQICPDVPAHTLAHHPLLPENLLLSTCCISESCPAIYISTHAHIYLYLLSSQPHTHRTTTPSSAPPITSFHPHNHSLYSPWTSPKKQSLQKEVFWDQMGQ